MQKGALRGPKNCIASHLHHGLLLFPTSGCVKRMEEERISRKSHPSGLPRLCKNSLARKTSHYNFLSRPLEAHPAEESSMCSAGRGNVRLGIFVYYFRRFG